MNYVALSVVALVCYAMVAPLVKLATRQIPPEVAVVITNSILALMAFSWAKFQGKSIMPYLTAKPIWLLVGAGIFLGISIIAYYLAIGAGPVSIVVPIYGLFIVVSSLMSVVLLGETLTITRVLGLVCAVLAIYLVTR
ncbi:EamA family transporter [Candidatus Acetothermia bacterium]|nr:EamA family transporter [Candidatus Acetothermia bacterium]MBI3461264.1 EamA family transporter [Candidatus Acetothermia bacterium]MBI3660586.1 EamA family transporter [Candidatus Acetothermia bacterium]